MRILLVYPRIRHIASSDLPPLGILYIASVIRDLYDVKIVDAHADNLTAEDIRNIAREFNPNIVGLSCNTLQVYEVFSIADKIKEESPEIKIVVGGPHPTIKAEEMLIENLSIDIAVIREGEITFKELVDFLKDNKPLQSVKGIVFREDGKITKTPPREYIKDLDKIPFPAHDLNEPLNRYKLHPILSILPSRGCPFECIFCSNPVWGKINRRRSAKNIVDEVEWLVNTYGAKGFDFHDDIFNLNRNFVENLCNELISRGLSTKIRWACEARVNRNLISKELMAKMKDAGCNLISFGIESGNQEILNIIQKNITIEEIKRAVALTKNVGIPTRGFFIIGHMNEDIYDVFDSIKLAKELDLNAVQFSIMIPFPGSDYYDIALKEKWILDADYSRYTASESHIETDKLSKKQLIYLKNVADFILLLKGNNLEIYSDYLLDTSERKIKIAKYTFSTIMNRIFKTDVYAILVSLKYLIRYFVYEYKAS